MENNVNDKISIAELFKHELLQKLDFLLLQVDKRLEQSIENDEQVRDIVGKIHHLTRGIDIDDFCCSKSGDGPMPLKSRRCRA